MTVAECNISNLLLKTKLCSSLMAVKYVNAIRYGYNDKHNELFNLLLFLKGAVRIIENYQLSDGVFAENGILNRFGKKALLSNNNSLSLESQSEKILIPEEDLNCFPESEICKLSEKVSSICSICLTC